MISRPKTVLIAFDDEFGHNFGAIGNLPGSGANAGAGTAFTQASNAIENYERHAKRYVSSHFFLNETSP